MFALLLVFGTVLTSCEPSVPPATVIQSYPVTKDTVANNVVLTDTTTAIEQVREREVPRDNKELGTATFYQDSISVNGEGFHFSRATDYAVVRILFNDDGMIRKVETMSDLPWSVVNKNTIFLKRGANLTRISRYFGIPIDRLLRCNGQIKNPNKLQSLTRLKLNCSNE